VGLQGSKPRLLPPALFDFRNRAKKRLRLLLEGVGGNHLIRPGPSAIFERLGFGEGEVGGQTQGCPLRTLPEQKLFPIIIVFNRARRTGRQNAKQIIFDEADSTTTFSMRSSTRQLTQPTLAQSMLEGGKAVHTLWLAYVNPIPNIGSWSFADLVQLSLVAGDVGIG
jgi:hypothetical protein